MIDTGLLWYDDDPRRSLAQKLADASDRYRERLGFEPTTCQLNPVLIPAAPAAAAVGAPVRRARARIAEPAIALRLIPNQHLRPNYFFVGIEAGEPAVRVPGWSAEDADDYERAPRSTSKAARLAKTATTLRRSRVAATNAVHVEKPAKTATINASVTPRGGTVGVQPAASTMKRTAESATTVRSTHAARAAKAAESAAASVPKDTVPRSPRGSVAKTPSKTDAVPILASVPAASTTRRYKAPKSAESATAVSSTSSGAPRKSRKAAEAATILPSSSSVPSVHSGVKSRTPAKTATVPASGARKPTRAKSPVAAESATDSPTKVAAPSKRARKSAESATALSSETPVPAKRTRKPAESATPSVGAHRVRPPHREPPPARQTVGAQPAAPSAPTTKKTAKTATAVPSALPTSPSPTKSRKATPPAESATPVSTGAPAQPKRPHKSAAESATPISPAAQAPAKRTRKPAAELATETASETPTLVHSARKPAETASVAVGAHRARPLRHERPHKPAATPAPASQTPVPSPAQATLWSDALAPTQAPARKRRTA